MTFDPIRLLPGHELDAFTLGLVRRKARQLVGRAGYTASDRDDLEQELLLKLHHSRRHFDPATAPWHAFATMVVERHTATLLRARRSARRAPHRVVPLDDDVGHDARRPGPALSEQERLDLRLDLAVLLARLPEDLRELAERLGQDSLTEIARQLGLPRTSLQRRLARLRTFLALMGVAENP